MWIGGNKTATLLAKKRGTKTKYGTRKNGFEEVTTILGYLDKRTTYDKHNVTDTEIEQGNHLFLCGYEELGEAYKELDEYDCGLMIDGKYYTITHFDNVMELNEHFEIYLRMVGDQVGLRTD